MLEGLLPDRSAEDIFAGRIRLTIAGKEYQLRTLVIADEEEWLASVDASPLAGLFGGIPNDNAAAMALLVSPAASDHLLNILGDYDREGILPPKEELRRTARPIEIVTAVLEVWQAAHPLLGISLIGMQELTEQIQTLSNGASPTPTSSPRRTGAGKPRRSARN